MVPSLGLRATTVPSLRLAYSSGPAGAGMPTGVGLGAIVGAVVGMGIVVETAVGAVDGVDVEVEALCVPHPTSASRAHKNRAWQTLLCMQASPSWIQARE